MYFKLTIIAMVISFSAIGFAADNYSVERQAMLEEIKSDTKLTSFATGKTELSTPVINALLSVPRHKFVRPRDQKHAYENRPLRIGHGQTISQPYIVALMTDLLNLKKNDKVLEVGTGSGYQAAILGELVQSVYTIEIIEPLANQARLRLSQLGYKNITVRTGDGYFGWQDSAPFDAIIVTAAASHIPPPLIKQLKPGGKMVIPVGSLFFTQQLMLIEKQPNGSVVSKQILPVVFVPLTGTH
jgi:protein-L-isoaspartate(D-aspartate) O-methyltransferase